ncbi:NAD(P)-dependent oxidoreductase [Saccharibacillus alkalitolerans]|uniref:SDR family oxidoreductase n=1 Tax=Saccharibacillus alkalitolerans TaxID=2705290 RepID=A0ABX0F965_9BACL|nr:SDR family oxidoreductase [Saccharibacillus alkalitolerans]NGZ77432.1 SDR family oxidoreductase [Saccharibacillus alkalitolerans]
MRILILGATGRVGSVITSLALNDGHEVTALVREAGKIQSHDRLNILQGDACDESDVGRAAEGADVVFSALNTDGTTTLSDSMPIIINVMREAGIRRIVTIGTAGILQSRTEPELLRYQSGESKRRSTRAAEEHRRVYELLKASDLDWTIVCPTYLPDGERLGRFRSERDYLPEGGTEISVPDTAEFAYGQIGDRRYIGARVGLAY